MKKNEISIKAIARLGGALYLIIIVTGMLGELYVRGKLVVWGDAEATANNIMSHQLLWRLGIAGDLLQHVCDVGLMVVFYLLLKPVSKPLALLALLLNVVSSAALVATKLNQWQALFPLGTDNSLHSFSAQQLHALMYMSIRADACGFGIGLIFFGFECLVVGYLIFQSLYLPKLIGVLMQIAGVCYIINSFALIVAPRFANMMFPFIMLLPFIGETSLCLWLLVKGVRMADWNEQLSPLASKHKR